MTQQAAPLPADNTAHSARKRALAYFHAFALWLFAKGNVTKEELEGPQLHSANLWEWISSLATSLREKIGNEDTLMPSTRGLLAPRITALALACIRLFRAEDREREVTNREKREGAIRAVLDLIEHYRATIREGVSEVLSPMDYIIEQRLRQALEGSLTRAHLDLRLAEWTLMLAAYLNVIELWAQIKEFALMNKHRRNQLISAMRLLHTTHGDENSGSADPANETAVAATCDALSDTLPLLRNEKLHLPAWIHDGLGRLEERFQRAIEDGEDPIFMAHMEHLRSIAELNDALGG